MKFVISFFLTCSAFAAPIRVLHEGSSIEAIMYKDILMMDYQIPEELIQVKSVEKCQEVRPVGKLDLCLKNNGDLYLVSVDREFINESLKVFRAP